MNAQHSGKGMLSISIQHMVDEKPLSLDSGKYVNDRKQAYTISKFTYYLSNFELVNTDKKDVIVNGSYLIDEEEPSSKRIDLTQLKSGSYRSIRFLIGVDSLHNCSGAQSGALDPVHAMFWAWNTGYIFLKLEGKSNSSTAPGHLFEYHIGGYKSPANSIRVVEITFPEPLVITDKKTTTLNLEVNVAEILKTPQSIDFSALPAVTDTKNACMMADNYKDMFRLAKPTK